MADINFNVISETEILSMLEQTAIDSGLTTQVFETSRIHIYYAVFARVFGNLASIFRNYILNLDIESCTEEALLDTLIKPFVQKHNATTAKTILTFRRRDIADGRGTDVFIPSGFEVMTETRDANPIVFRTIESKIIWKDAYQVKVPAVSIEYGSLNNVAANTLTFFNDAEYANFSVTNENPAYGGRDEESTYDARSRIYNYRWARDGTSTNITSVLGRLNFYGPEYSTTEYWAGFGTTLIALDVDSDEEFHDIIRQINLVSPPGVKYFYSKVKQLDVDFNVNVKVTGNKLFDEYTLEDVENSIKTAITVYFTNNMAVGENLSQKRLEAFVLNYIRSDFEIYEIDTIIDNINELKINKSTEMIEIKPYERLHANRIVIRIEYVE